MSVNKVMLLGHLGQDPESRAMPSGSWVANFRIATNRRYKDKEGQLQEATDWHNIVAYGRTAEIVGKYLQKGKPVFVEGRLRTREWQDKQGNPRYTTEVVVDDFRFIGSRGPEGNTGPANGAGLSPGAATPRSDDIPF